MTIVLTFEHKIGKMTPMSHNAFKKNLVVSIAIFSISSIIFSLNTSEAISRFNPKRATLELQVGAFTASQGTSQHVNISGLIGDDFSVVDAQDLNALLGLGYFVDGTTSEHVKTLFGVNAFYLA